MRVYGVYAGISSLCSPKYRGKSLHFVYCVHSFYRDCCKVAIEHALASG